STGNEYNTTAISYPSCIKNVTRVGSTTKTDEISNFSNRWGLDMLFAPGSNINSTYLNNNYIIGSGTSMAAPHVSGAILIIKQALQLVGDNFTPSEIFELLNKTGKRINDTNGNGLNYSRIEVYSAINGIDGEKYNDILFNSSFEGGNLINVTYVSGNILGQRKYKASINYSIKNFSENHWWFYFNMKNVSDKKITIEIENLSSEDFNEGRWQSKHPFYSYNITDQDNWARISYGNFLSGNNITKNFSITIQPTEDSVWIAPIPPYTLTMRDNLLNSYSSNQYLNLTNLGVTPLGYNLTLATITNQKFSNEKKHKIYIIAQQHSFESIGSYEVEGIIKFLLSENETAEALRRSYIFRIIPIINVDGVYSGTSRYTPFRNDSQYDLNRVWFNNESLIINDSTTPEINWTLNDIINFMPDAFFDLHGDGTNKTDNYFIRAVNNEQINLLLNNLSRGRENNSDYWPETGARLTSNEDSNTSNRAVYTRLGLNFSLILESPYNNLTNTTEHPVPYNPQTIADWKKWGEKLILGIYSYFQDIYWINVTPSSINKGGNITIEANIFRENINKVWYNITNSSGSHGTGFMENNSLTYYKTSYNTTNLSAGWYNVTIYANDSSNDIVKLSRKIFVSVTSEGGNNQSGGESNNNSNSNEDSTDQSSEKKQEVQNKSLQEISETNNTFLYPKEEITIPREKILEGYSTTLKLKEGLSFEIYKKEENKKEIHELFLNEIMNDSANLTIKSEPINFLIRLNEEKKFNLTSPDYYNLKIRLNEIIDKEKINLTIKEIYESIEKENFILLLLEKVKKKIKILALSFVFVMIIISYFFIKKIRKNSVVRGSRRSR
ncbi:MAG: M14-type cytosolic carboxypeptidase, partial [Candidatus Pacearchaeota archaeon]